MSKKEPGLFRLMSLQQQDKVEETMAVSFGDLHHLTSALGERLRELEDVLNCCFYGDEDYAKLSDES